MPNESEQEATRTTRAAFGTHTLKVAALFGIVMGLFSVTAVAFKLQIEPMLIVGWLCFVGLTAIGLANYAGGNHD